MKLLKVESHGKVVEKRSNFLYSKSNDTYVRVGNVMPCFDLRVLIDL